METTISRAELIAANKMSLTVVHERTEYKRYFDGDKDYRYVFTCVLRANGKRYTFTFGQSIAKGNTAPTLDDVLSCFTWYDVDSFEDFCGDYGYDSYSRKAYKTHLACEREYKAMCRLFPSEELRMQICEAFQ
jgi:hypothetical protein